MNSLKTIYLKIISLNKIFLAAIIAVIYKVLQFILVSPQIVPDSADYITVSKTLFTLSPDTFGLRTPGYPLFIKILSIFTPDLNFIIAAQLLLGIISVILIYLIIKGITGSMTALVSSLLFLFSPASLYDSVISSESLAVFLNILFLFAVIRSVRDRNNLFSILSGVILTLLIFTRPQYLLFIPALGIYFAIQRSGLKTYSMIIIPLIISIVWMFGVYRITGMFNMTTLAGYNLINHTGKYIEKAPAEYETLKSIYIKQRNEDLSLRGNQSGTIWKARDTLQKTLQLNKTELSVILNRINQYLILNYPLKYLRSVWASLRIALIVPDDDFRIINNSFIFRLPVPLYQVILGTGFTAGLFGLVLFRKNKLYSLHLLMVFLAAANLIASCLFDYGTNGRFFAPSYFVLFIWCTYLFTYIKNFNKDNSELIWNSDK